MQHPLKQHPNVSEPLDSGKQSVDELQQELALKCRSELELKETLDVYQNLFDYSVDAIIIKLNNGPSRKEMDNDDHA